MKLKNVFLTLFSLLILSTLGYAQDNTVRGFVFDQETKEPIAYAKVILKSKSETPTTQGANSDLDGFFSLAQLDKGFYYISVRASGYLEIKDSILLDKEKSIQNLRFDLKKPEDVKEIEGVEISASDKSKTTEVEISMVKLDQKGLERLPSFGAENDIVSAISVTPGVVTTGDQGGQIYVRGGTPIQNKILLDGMTIYNPFHSIGFFSVFETELVKSADVYTGGFDAQYGGRISSVMDITYRDGKSSKLGGKFSISPFMAKAVMEGPLTRSKDSNSNAGSTFIFSAKKSLLDYSSRSAYPYVNNGSGLPFDFTDLYGKVTFKGDMGSKVSFFGFNNNDRVNYANVADLNWTSSGGGLNFLLIPGSSPIYIKGHLNASGYNIFFQENDSLAPRESSINGFDLGFDFTYFLKNQSEINYGINLGSFNTDFVTYNSTTLTKIQSKENNTEFAGYFNYRLITGRWVIQPGIRLQYYASLSELMPEPRIAAKFNATEDLRFKVSGGRYTQNFTSAASDRDIVNLFYGFLSAPTSIPSTFTYPNGKVVDVDNGLQVAWHAIGGFEYDFTKNLSLNVEGYYKYFPRLSNINNNKLYDDISAFYYIADESKKDFLIESGFAYGVDVLLKYTKDRLFLWGVYSYGKTRRWDGFEYYTPLFDRRHNINLVGTYAFGEKKNIELSVRWNLGTGLPFTPTVGNYQGETFSEGVTTDYTTSNVSEPSLLLGTLNSARLPTYHRFDITLKQNYELKNKNKVEIIVGVTNVYNRENIFYVNRLTNEKIYQLPILPSVGVNYKF
ncbi:TonB-dependent receptor [Lishizhenia tianjinensis]|nr:carboxypeptidase regulatory-like domain-containing protein [Lishizhenia tianjinensis]